MIAPIATVVITTKNRKDDLTRALDSCFLQNVPLEVLVLDDGSDDGTSAMVAGKYPRVQLHRSEESKGLVVQRNAGARLASAEIIISMDDDAEFSSPGIVAAVVAAFSHDSVAAVAIPFINTKQGDELHQSAPDHGSLWITNEFIGTAHAVRRSVFLRLGGYREVIFHQGEEGDFCIRLLQAGYFVRLLDCPPILHHESPKRSFERMNVFGQRNLILFTWHNVPFPEFLLHLCATVVNGLLWGLRRGVLRFRLRGTWRGFCMIFQEWSQREPVTSTTYWLYRRLKKEGPIPVQVIRE